MRWWMMVVLLVGWNTIPAAQQEGGVCPGAGDLPPRLEVGLWGRVAHDGANNLREAPTTTAPTVGQIPAGDIFRALDGPRCADGYVWWQVSYAGRTGWTAEGNADPADYWLEPIHEAQAPVDPLPDEPEGCLKPPENYQQFYIGRATVNLRTLAMLDRAQEIYQAGGGIVRLRDAIMQGSYNPGGVSASFGTHDGGGALDLSVRDRIDYHILTAEIEPMITALRAAGFAAWLRDSNELYAGSPIHIHAIAIGDAELSEAAREQIDGTFGYLRGYDGLPRDDGVPQADRYGDPLICGWMVEMGFEDLRN